MRWVTLNAKPIFCHKIKTPAAKWHPKSEKASGDTGTEPRKLGPNFAAKNPKESTRGNECIDRATPRTKQGITEGRTKKSVGSSDLHAPLTSWGAPRTLTGGQLTNRFVSAFTPVLVAPHWGNLLSPLIKWTASSSVPRTSRTVNSSEISWNLCLYVFQHLQFPKGPLRVH